MFCPTCGAESGDTSRFCVTCGNVLPVPAAATIDAQGVPGSGPDSSGLAMPIASSGTAIPSYPGTPAYPLSSSGTPAQGEASNFGQPPPQWSPGNAIPGSPLAPFGAPLAGWWQRVGSLLLDILILDVPYVIIAGIISATTRSINANGVHQSNGVASRVLVGVFFIVQAIYFSYLNGVGRGQTPGNRATNIAVRDINTGEPIGAGRGFLRWFVRILLYILVIPGVINDLLPLWSARRQTIADKAANSVMIRV